MGRKGLASHPSTACMLKLMTCFNKLKTLRRRPRRLWLMLPDLPTNSVPNKITLELKKKPNVLWILKSVSWKTVLLKLTRLPLKEDEMPWPNWREESVKWKWNLEESKAKHLRLTRLTKNLSVASRNWHKSSSKRSRLTRSKLKKLRRSLLLILPSTARLNKSSRKLKTDPEWPKDNFPSYANFSSSAIFVQAR